MKNGIKSGAMARAERAYKLQKLLIVNGLNGAPGEIRTPDLLIRSQSLYPAELRAHKKSYGTQWDSLEPFTD